jgi:uncharacterized cupin superfamily protein
VGIAHWDEASLRRPRATGHLQGTWTFLGEASGSVGVGVRRIELPPGGWSTPAHAHGREEEIFFVLAGRGLSWQDGETYEIRAGDCVVYLAGGVAHTLYAIDPLDVLAFGPREDDEGVAFPRLGMSYAGNRLVDSIPSVTDGLPTQFVRESALGPPELPAPGSRPSTIVNLDDVDPATEDRPRVGRTRRNLGRAAGSRTTGLQHVTVAPGMWSAPQHCHSVEEELFVVLDGDGILLLGDEETPVRTGHVVSRPPATGIAHAFRAGDRGLVYLAYGTREPSDTCWYPRSGKIAWSGLGVVARVERLDYWDGED